jgi:hypothetical protein
VFCFVCQIFWWGGGGWVGGGGFLPIIKSSSNSSWGWVGLWQKQNLSYRSQNIWKMVITVHQLFFIPSFLFHFCHYSLRLLHDLCISEIGENACFLHSQLVLICIILVNFTAKRKIDVSWLNLWEIFSSLTRGLKVLGIFEKTTPWLIKAARNLLNFIF